MILDNSTTDPLLEAGAAPPVRLLQYCCGAVGQYSAARARSREDRGAVCSPMFPGAAARRGASFLRVPSFVPGRLCARPRALRLWVARSVALLGQLSALLRPMRVFGLGGLGRVFGVVYVSCVASVWCGESGGKLASPPTGHGRSASGGQSLGVKCMGWRSSLSASGFRRRGGRIHEWHSPGRMCCLD